MTTKEHGGFNHIHFADNTRFGNDIDDENSSDGLAASCSNSMGLLSVDTAASGTGDSASPLPSPFRSPNRSSLIKEGGKRREVAQKKSVSFGSMPSDKKISNVLDCLNYMHGGCDLIKVRSNSRRYRRHFSLDSDNVHLRWTPTSKKPHKAKIPVDAVKEIRMGKNTDTLRSSETTLDDFPDDCAFSIIWGETYESLDLIAASPDEANIWVTGLMALTSGNCDQINGRLPSQPSLRDRWLEENFRIATGPGCSCLDEADLIKLFRRLSFRTPAAKISQKLKELECLKASSSKESSTTPKGKFTCEDFSETFKELCTKPEVYFLIVRYANKDYLSTEDLQLFLETEQGLAGTTKEHCQAIIDKYEPSEEARDTGLMTIDGFTEYLLSEECTLFDSSHNVVCQDMSEPLNHYFISASNNTYLTEDQLKGPSSVDGYVRALKRGCRYIELDLWEAEDCDEPVVYHGHTMTTKLPLTKALKAIAEYAFEKTNYPLIIHLEVHLSLSNQNLVAKLLRHTFGNRIFTGPLNYEEKVLPSPGELKGKVLFKAKRLPDDTPETEDSGEVTEEDESYDLNKNNKIRRSSLATRKVPWCKTLSDLVVLESARFLELENAMQSQNFYQLCNINESTAARLMANSPEALLAYNKRFITRVYPSGVRVDSSNFNPQDLWNCGCQLVAMNFQTAGLMMDLYDGKFSANGGCGYVLKPAPMREELSYFSVHDGIPGVAPQILHLKVISAQQLPRPRGSSAKGDSCDPYVIVEVFGVPSDCAEERTKTVKNDSYNPLFDESFEFHVSVPELTLVRFLVLDDDFIQDDFIGQYTIPFDCIQPGYRHVKLLSADGEPLENAELFVHIAVTNRRGGGKATKRGMSVKKKRAKVQTGIKLLGIKTLDDNFKLANPSIVECIELKTGLETALVDFQESCCLGPTANLKQAIRILLSRWQAAVASPGAGGGEPESPEPKLTMRFHNEYPELEPEASIPEVLKKSFVNFDKVFHNCKACLAKCDPLANKMDETCRRIVESCDDLGGMCNQAGLKGPKASRASENYGWNVRLLKGHAESLRNLQKEAQDCLQQVKDCAAASGILKECSAIICQHYGHSAASSVHSPTAVAQTINAHGNVRQHHSSGE